MDGGGGNQTTVSSGPPEWMQPYISGYLDTASQVSQQPYTPYDQQRVANLSPTQTMAIGGLHDLAGGTGSQRAAEGMLTGTLQGGYQNPYAMQGVGSGGQYGFNPLSGGQNQYMGDNPYFRQSLQTQLGDITDAYQRGTSADTTRLFNLSGAFGGSAHQNAVANNERELGRTLGNVANTAHQQQYDRSANLAESGLNRNLQAGQFNANLGNTAFENAAQRGLQSGMFNANLGSGAYESERNRQMQAVQGATGLASGMGQNYLNALQGGDIERRQNQSLLDSAYGDFREWRDYPDSRLNLFGGALGNVMGRAGGTQTSQGPGYDPVSQGMGLMMLANGMGDKGGAGAGV